jgi:hypothetical protein
MYRPSPVIGAHPACGISAENADTSRPDK